MAHIKKVRAGWIVVSDSSNDPVINRVFKSRIDALHFAQQFSPGNY